MFLSMNDLANPSTEVSYPGSPSVEEQMLLFHSSPMDITAETAETAKADGHKQQAITSGWDGALGQEGNAAPKRGDCGGIATKLLPFGAGFALGVGLCYLLGKR